MSHSHSDASLRVDDAIPGAWHAVVAMAVAVHGRELVVSDHDQQEALSLLAHQAINAMNTLKKLRAEETSTEATSPTNG